MDRRGFFKVIGALAAVAAAQPVLAAATDPHAKYRRARELFMEAARARGDTDLVNKRMNLLLEHLHANFPVPEVSDANRQAMGSLLALDHGKWTGSGPSELNVLGVPPSVADMLYPVALVKLGLCAFDMSFDLVPESNTFLERYGQLIIWSIEG